MKYILVASIGRYTAPAVRAVVTMATCCHGNTHELFVHCTRSNRLVECVTSPVGLEGKPVWQVMQVTWQIGPHIISGAHIMAKNSILTFSHRQVVKI